VDDGVVRYRATVELGDELIDDIVRYSDGFRRYEDAYPGGMYRSCG